VSGAGQIKTTKDGKVLLDEMVPFFLVLFSEFPTFRLIFVFSSPSLHLAFQLVSKFNTPLLPLLLVPPQLKTT
jgi:hypothetical protein